MVAPVPLFAPCMHIGCVEAFWTRRSADPSPPLTTESPTIHTTTDYRTVLSNISCPYRSVCGTDAACSSNTIRDSISRVAPSLRGTRSARPRPACGTRGVRALTLTLPPAPAEASAVSSWCPRGLVAMPRRATLLSVVWWRSLLEER